jgi:hypothetical protein
MASSNSSVATYSPATRIVAGVAPGTAALTAGALVNLVFTVSLQVGIVVALRSFVYQASATVVSIPATSIEGVAITTTVKPGLALNAEGAVASIVTYALGNDGAYTDVSLYPGLSITSIDTTDITAVNTSGVWTAVVPIGASTLAPGAYLNAVLKDPSTSTVLQTGVGYLYTSLATILNVTVKASLLKVTVPGDPAIGLGIPTSAQLTVTVYFSDGTNQVLTSDARTVYTVSSGSVSSTGMYTSVSGTPTGSFTITVTFASTWLRAAGSSGNVTLTVVKMTALSAALTHSLPVGGLVASLKPIQCTATYQQGVLSSIATFSDSSILSATASTSFTTATSAFATLSGTTVTGKSAGTAVINGSYSGFTTSVSVPVVSTGASVSSITLTYSLAYLAAKAGGTMSATVPVQFSDGTSYTNAITQFPGNLSTFLSFAVDDTARLTVSSAGVLTLVNNSYTSQVVTATAVCPANASLVKTSTASVAGNVLPEVNDAKLGYLTGIPVRATNASQNIVIALSFNTGTANLLSWQFNFYYDAAVYGVPTLTIASAWAGYTSTLNPAAQSTGQAPYALLLGSTTASTLTQTTTVATITLPVKSSYTMANLDLITGYTTVLRTSTSTVYNNAFVQTTAGTGFVMINSGTTKVSTSSPPTGRRRVLEHREAHRRELLSSPVGASIFGDTDGNGVCNAADVYNVQLAVASGNAGIAQPLPNTTTGKQYVPTLSYMQDNMASSYTAAQMLAQTTDFVYIAQAAGHYYIFLSINTPWDLVPQLPSNVNSTMLLSAPFNDYSGSGAKCTSTAVTFEVNMPTSNIATSPNALTGYRNYTELVASCTTDGYFYASLTVVSPLAAYNVSVKFVTTDSQSVTASFGFYGGDGFPLTTFTPIYTFVQPPFPPLPPPSPRPPPPSPSPPLKRSPP